MKRYRTSYKRFETKKQRQDRRGYLHVYYGNGVVTVQEVLFKRGRIVTVKPLKSGTTPPSDGRCVLSHSRTPDPNSEGEASRWTI